MKVNIVLVLFLFSFSLVSNSQNLETDTTLNKPLVWLLSDIIKNKPESLEISGNPKLVTSSYGDAVYFNGVEDALFLNEMPLKSLEEFTVEMIFNPANNSPFEQRVLHIGEISGDRMLLEIRAVGNSWYFDGFVASGENKKALIDEKLVHPLGQWQHVAFVVTKNGLKTYVNGNLELSEPITFVPFESGKSSIGVRLNKRSWFNGEIYKITITPRQLQPADFTMF